MLLRPAQHLGALGARAPTVPERMLTIGRCAVYAAITISAYGCENRDGASLIAGCERILVESVRSSGKPVDTTCEMNGVQLLAALPGVDVPSERLVAAGLPDDVAVLLSKRASTRSEWCTVHEMDQQPRPEGITIPLRRFEARCVESALLIPSATVVRAYRVVLTGVRADDGAVRLVGLTVSGQ